MSGDSPPPKPKPGSLRDRIAAFEKKPEQNAPHPPAPRPKPGHVQWKPRPASPPPPPVNAGEGAEGGGHGTATDAKESIGAGGLSLKERMAALQGRGAFAAPPPPAPAPKPASERKWKPPPAPVPVAPPDAESEVEHHDTAVTTTTGGDGGATGSAAEETPEATEEDKPAQAQDEGGSAAEAAADDPEEEERQRRAAIAARMARLGGARIGMGPPVFAPKSRAQPPKGSPPLAPPESPDEAAGTTSDGAEGGPSDSSPLSPESGSGSSARNMPIPSGPRRAGPPRRRPPKSPGAASGELPALPSEGEVEKDKADATVEESAPSAREEARGEVPPAPEEETEEETAARRKRIADRIAKSGGINPFAGPRPVQHDEEEQAQDAAVAAATEAVVVPEIEATDSEDKAFIVARKIEVAEAEAETPPRSPSVPDEPSIETASETAELEGAPPLPPKFTTGQAEEANAGTKTVKKGLTTEFPTKEEESVVPVVDLSQSAQVSTVLEDADKGTKKPKVEEAEKQSLDITEAAVEYRDVRSVEDADEDTDERETTKIRKKDKHARKDSQALPEE